MLVFKQNSPFEQTQFIEVGVASFKFYLLSQRYMLCDIENGFYWLVYFHYEYLRAQVMKIFFFFFTKITCLSRHSFGQKFHEFYINTFLCCGLMLRYPCFPITASRRSCADTFLVVLHLSPMELNQRASTIKLYYWLFIPKIFFDKKVLLGLIEGMLVWNKATE